MAWLNKYSEYTISGFDGVPAKKLVMGVLASTSAGGAAYYAPPATVK
jgi:hypothetical protein